MGMYVTINGQDIKFSGMLALAYENLFYAHETGNVIEITQSELEKLIPEMARLIDATPMNGGYSLASIQARRIDLAKLYALIDYATNHDTECKNLVFA